jgi:ubiquinone biosynthesis protein COQ4
MPRRRPLVAIKALRQLIADPEDTERVFEILRALSGDAIADGHARFAKTAIGARVLREQRDLLATLCDRESLRRLPEGSLGREYLTLVERAGITADGLVAASEVNVEGYESLTPGEAFYARRLRDMHDLWHTVCGFSTRPFGEVCVVSFTYAQTKNLGLGAIALIGALKIARETRDFGVLKAAWQAYRIGRRAAWWPAQDWEAMLAEPLEVVRRKLRLESPTRYQRVSARLNAVVQQPA